MCSANNAKFAHFLTLCFRKIAARRALMRCWGLGSISAVTDLGPRGAQQPSFPPPWLGRLIEQTCVWGLFRAVKKKLPIVRQPARRPAVVQLLHELAHPGPVLRRDGVG